MPRFSESGAKTYAIAAYVYRIPARWMTRGQDPGKWLGSDEAFKAMGGRSLEYWTNHLAEGFKIEGNNLLPDGSGQTLYALVTNEEVILLQPVGSEAENKELASWFKRLYPWENTPID